MVTREKKPFIVYFLAFSVFFSQGISPPQNSGSNETPRTMKMDPLQHPLQHRSSVSGPLSSGGYPHSYEFHTKRKMFDKGPEVC